MPLRNMVASEVVDEKYNRLKPAQFFAHPISFLSNGN